MNKLPWMKYDPDIISMDVDVDGMSLTEEGAYSRAVRHIWRNGPLPESKLHRICGPSLEAVILCMEERDGAWSFAWLEEARGKSKAWVQQRSEAGKASANKRATVVERSLNEPATVVLSLSPSSSNSLSSEKKGQDPEKAKEEFKSKCAEAVEALKEPMPKEERAAFFAYWTEANARGQMRFQDQKYFDHKRRMETWMRNAVKRDGFGKPAAPLPSPTLKPWMQ